MYNYNTNREKSIISYIVGMVLFISSIIIITNRTHYKKEYLTIISISNDYKECSCSQSVNCYKNSKTGCLEFCIDDNNNYNKKNKFNCTEQILVLDLSNNNTCTTNTDFYYPETNLTQRTEYVLSKLYNIGDKVKTYIYNNKCKIKIDNKKDLGYTLLAFGCFLLCLGFYIDNYKSEKKSRIRIYPLYNDYSIYKK